MELYMDYMVLIIIGAVVIWIIPWIVFFITAYNVSRIKRKFIETQDQMLMELRSIRINTQK